MNADRDKSEQPKWADMWGTAPDMTEADLTGETTEHRIACDKCGQIMGLFHKDCDGKWVREYRTVTEWNRTTEPKRPESDAQRPRDATETPDTSQRTPDAPEAATEAHSDEAYPGALGGAEGRVERYAEAVDAHGEAESEPGYNRWRCTCGEVIATGRQARAMAALRAHQARAVMAVADAEQADLRAEVERLRHSERLGWDVHAEHVERMNVRSLRDQAIADDWKKRAEVGGRALSQIESLAKAQAASCAAMHRADIGRNWLDVLAIIGDAALAEPEATEGGA